MFWLYCPGALRSDPYCPWWDRAISEPIPYNRAFQRWAAICCYLHYPGEDCDRCPFSTGRNRRDIVVDDMECVSCNLRSNRDRLLG
jgi:hypothetical protein